MQKQIIKPASSKAETFFVLLTIVLVVGASGMVIKHRTQDLAVASGLDAFQVSAFNDLNSIEQGFYSDLYTAGSEVLDYYDIDSRWPSPEDMAKEFIPPFVEDATWKNRGEPAWIFLEPLGGGNTQYVVYLAHTNDSAASGSFILLVNMAVVSPDPSLPEPPKDNPYEIWYHANNQQKLPPYLSRQTLIGGGWQEVVPYKGEEERERLQGKKG